MTTNTSNSTFNQDLNLEDFTFANISQPENGILLVVVVVL